MITLIKLLYTLHSWSSINLLLTSSDPLHSHLHFHPDSLSLLILSLPLSLRLLFFLLLLFAADSR